MIWKRKNDAANGKNISPPKINVVNIDHTDASECDPTATKKEESKNCNVTAHSGVTVIVPPSVAPVSTPHGTTPDDGVVEWKIGPNESFAAMVWLFAKMTLYYSVAWALCGIVAGFLVCSTMEGRSVLWGLSGTVLAPVGCAIGILKATRRGWLQEDDSSRRGIGIVRRRVRVRLERWMQRHQRWEEMVETIAEKFPVVVESIISERSYTILKWTLPIFLPSAKVVFAHMDRLKGNQHVNKLSMAVARSDRGLAEKLTCAVSSLCDAHLERWEFRLSVIGVAIFALSAGLGGAVDSIMEE